MNRLVTLSSSRRLTLRPIAAALCAALLSAAAPSSASDALLAIESNRPAIVEQIVERFGAPLVRLGIDATQLRLQLYRLRADQLLAASLVNDLAALDLTQPTAPEARQRYVAVVPVPPGAFAPEEAPLAVVARIGGALRVLPPQAVVAPGGTEGGDALVVGYFADGRAPAAVTSTLVLKDGAGTGANSWIGYTAGNNQASGQGSAVMAGLNNTASGPVSAVISGNGNVASGQGAFVGGGDLHQSSGNYSIIVGGYANKAANGDAVVVGGVFNENRGQRSFMGAGSSNLITPDAGYSVIVGGGRDTGVGSGAAGSNALDNVALTKWTFIGGGFGNTAGNALDVANTPLATVVGGFQNTASGRASFVGGGGCNQAAAPGASVVGGGQTDETAACGADANIASGGSSTVAGGTANVASGDSATVIGGSGNQSTAIFAVVSGGSSNRASGVNSAVIGGSSNVASGLLSVAMGFRAKTQSADPTPIPHPGAFVFADVQSTDFNSAGPNTFNIRASGGVRLDPSTSLRFGDGGRQHVTLFGDPAVIGASYGLGVQSGAMYYRIDGSTSGGGFAWYRGGAHSNSTFDGGGGLPLMTLDRTGALTVSGAVNAAGFNTVSDRAAKLGFESVDPVRVLAAVAALPISTWRYREDASGARHIGPMAQDFRQLFGLGRDERTINLADGQGVAFAAIQGLNAKLEADKRALEARNARLEAESRLLRGQLAAAERERSADRARVDAALRELREQLSRLGAGARAR